MTFWGLIDSGSTAGFIDSIFVDKYAIPTQSTSIVNSGGMKPGLKWVWPLIDKGSANIDAKQVFLHWGWIRF